MKNDLTFLAPWWYGLSESSNSRKLFALVSRLAFLLLDSAGRGARAIGDRYE